MDALEFAKQKRRLCTYYEHNGGCRCCVLGSKSRCFIGRTENSLENDRATIEAAEKWAKSHPEKTRQNEFLKMFPSAKTDERGVLVVPPCVVDRSYGVGKDKANCCIGEGCDDCRRKYWLATMEEEG